MKKTTIQAKSHGRKDTACGIVTFDLSEVFPNAVRDGLLVKDSVVVLDTKECGKIPCYVNRAGKTVRTFNAPHRLPVPKPKKDHKPGVYLTLRGIKFYVQVQ